MSVNVGIMGFAHGHVVAYCRRWRSQEELDVRVVAGWDRDRRRAAANCEEFECRPCATPEDLAARNDVHAVVIGAETAFHADLVETAAAARKAIILQKPIALTLSEADRIIAAVEAAAVPFTIAWQMRCDPQNLRIKRLVDSGAVGKVLMVRRRHGLSTHTWEGFAQTWHNDPKLNRDIWADDASHAADFILWLLGKPASVTAELATLLDPAVPNDNGIAVFRYDNGPMAEICCSFTCMAGENTTEVVGEKGVIIQNYGDAPSANAPRPPGAIGLKWILRGDADWTVSDIPTPGGHGDRIQHLAAPIAEFLHGRRGPIATAAQGRDALAMVLACYDSSRRGRRIDLG